MLKAALRDLQWRWKRFVIAMIGVSLVFAMGLIMTGLTASFSIETSRTLDSIGAQRWAVASDASGPFSSSSLISTSSASDSEGSPVMVLRETIKDGSKVRDVIMMGVEPGKLGSPRTSSGADLAQPGQVVVDGSLPGADVNDTINIGGKDFLVVGETSGQSLFAGIPLVYVSLEDAQAIAVLGQPLATTLLFDHIPTFVPRDLKVLSNAEV
jgi:putative ABC transport system permease protein